MKARSIKKQVLIFAVCMIMLCANVITVFASSDVVPCYDNVAYAVVYTDVSSDGELEIMLEYEGYSSTTKAVINVCIEKKTLFFFWSDEAEWSDTLYVNSYCGMDSYQLPDEGTYRVTVTFEVYGSDGTVDTIIRECEIEW